MTGARKQDQMGGVVLLIAPSWCRVCTTVCVLHVKPFLLLIVEHSEGRICVVPGMFFFFVPPSYDIYYPHLTSPAPPQSYVGQT